MLGCYHCFLKSGSEVFRYIRTITMQRSVIVGLTCLLILQSILMSTLQFQEFQEAEAYANAICQRRNSWTSWQQEVAEGGAVDVSPVCSGWSCHRLIFFYRTGILTKNAQNISALKSAEMLCLLCLPFSNFKASALSGRAGLGLCCITKHDEPAAALMFLLCERQKTTLQYTSSYKHTYWIHFLLFFGLLIFTRLSCWKPGFSGKPGFFRITDVEELMNISLFTVSFF